MVWHFNFTNQPLLDMKNFHKEGILIFVLLALGTTLFSQTGPARDSIQINSIQASVESNGAVALIVEIAHRVGDGFGWLVTRLGPLFCQCDYFIETES